MQVRKLVNEKFHVVCLDQLPHLVSDLSVIPKNILLKLYIFRLSNQQFEQGKRIADGLDSCFSPFDLYYTFLQLILDFLCKSRKSLPL